MLQLNNENLYRVFRDFHTLTKIRIVIFDNDFQELLAYPHEWQGFCTVLRSDAAEDAKCRNSDREKCVECAKRRELILYRCHAGLTEAVVPIYDKNGVMGYVMFGQVISAERCEEIRSHMKNRYPMLQNDIDQITVKPEKELEAAATILQALTAYVINNGWVVPGKSEFIRQMDQYIEKNISEVITVEDLCLEFNLNRSRMYALSTTYLGCGLAEYVRTRRILFAQRLLAETELSIIDVASTVGFSDYNRFYRVFRQVCGISPNRYRKQALT